MEMVDAMTAVPSDAKLVQENTPHQPPKIDADSQPCSRDGIQGVAPVPLKVPKAFNFPERYMSPTDRIISPISKNLLARNRKTGPILPPSINPSKTLESCFQDARLFRT